MPEACRRWRPLLLAGLLALAAAAAAQPAAPQPQPLAASRQVVDAGAVVTLFAAPAAQQRQQVLTIDGATETSLIEPVIRDFQRRHPGLAVRYADRPSLDIHARALAHAQAAHAADAFKPDLLISSSLDLQTQLANDGLALPHRSALTLDLPAGAHWRHEVFSLGAEPVVMVYNPRLLPEASAPRTRGELLALLRQPGSPLAGRVGMYDARRSGLGYLLATQDARFDSAAGVLLAALGAAGVLLGDHIVPLLEQLEQGRLALLYNVPASYAQARIAGGAPLRVIYPQDYTLLTTRAAVIPASAGQPELARLFLDHLLSPEGQAVLARETRLLPIRAALAIGQGTLAPPDGAGGPAGASVAPGAWRPLAPGLGLLVYLDALKRQRFLQLWSAAAAPGLAPDAGSAR